MLVIVFSLCHTATVSTFLYGLSGGSRIFKREFLKVGIAE